MLLDVTNLQIVSIQSHIQETICRNISFSVELGETLGILGESGSGKSITALSILRILPPSLCIKGGNINFTRKDCAISDLANCAITDLQRIRGKEISMVFQEPMTSLNPVYTCGDQVLETILQHQQHGGSFFENLKKSSQLKYAKDQVISLFQKVKLPEPERIFNSYPYQLSGGQKQRVMIAMAISCNPRLLIADEPTTALDVTVQRSILDLLKELQAELGMSIMFITHDISVISEIAQRVLVFNRGEIVEQGEISQVITSPKHPYTQGLMACRKSITNRKQRLITLDDFLNPKEAVVTSSINKHLEDRNAIPILKIQNLNLSFQRSSGLFGKSSRKQILHDINLDIFANETVGLVGESGSGKTTIGRSIMKLIETESGSIDFNGVSINKLSSNELKKFRKKVQIIFQDPYSSLNPKHTVGDIIAEPMIVHKLFHSAKERKMRVLELLHQVNLSEDHYERYPHQFSGGQRQRIGIARALAVQPELIILDESVSALDVSIQAQVLNLLNDLKKIYKLTYLFISHDLNTVRYMSDRIVVLKDGKVVEKGDAEDIFTNPQSPYTISLLTSAPSKI